MSVMPPNENPKSVPKAKKKVKPAEKQQKDLIRFVEGKVPRGLGHNKAKTTIRAYKDDPEKAAKLKEYEDIQDAEMAAEEAKDEAKWAKQYAKERFEENIDSIQEQINDHLDDYGLKRVSKKLIKEACLQFEKSGRADFHKATYDFDFWDLTAKIAYQIMQNHPEKIHYEDYTPFFYQDYTDERLCNEPIKRNKTEDSHTTPLPDDFPVKVEISMSISDNGKEYSSVEAWEADQHPKDKPQTLVKNTPQSFGQRVPQPNKWATERTEQKQLSQKWKKENKPLVITLYEWLLIIIGVSIILNLIEFLK